jgi:ribosomal-protein-alanine N-acetyltransferase
MKHIGTKVIETNRLILRAFKATDAELMFKNWANDDRVTKYLRWLPHENVELTKKLCMIWEDNSKNENNYQWIIIIKDENTPIGSIGIVDIDE